MFPFKEVSSLAFLCADLPRARTWVAETLGRLASDGRREEELRRTLRIYNRARLATTALTCCGGGLRTRLNRSVNSNRPGNVTKNETKPAEP